MQETQVQSRGQEDFPGGGHGNPLQYSCLENPMDRGAWWATVHGGVAKSQTRLMRLSIQHSCWRRRVVVFHLRASEILITFWTNFQLLLHFFFLILSLSPPLPLPSRLNHLKFLPYKFGYVSTFHNAYWRFSFPLYWKITCTYPSA